jgi:hypothetical protein
VTGKTETDPKVEEFRNAVFEIGGRDQLERLRQRYGDEPQAEKAQALCDDWAEELRKLQVRVGTLLKTDTVSFLFGAGVSVDCGGVLFGSIPLEIEKALLEEGIENDSPATVAAWLQLFYLAAEEVSQGSAKAPTNAEAILERRKKGGRAEPLKVNFEAVVSQIYRWRHAVGISRSSSLDVTTEWVHAQMSEADIRTCLDRVNQTLARVLDLPLQGKEHELDIFKSFLRRLLTRPLNLKRASIFTLNYDTLVEKAADAEGIALVDGFAGTLKRVFRPETYDQDFYFPAQTTEGRVHRYDRVLHLHKLHGSLTWQSEEPSLDNPFGISAGGRPVEGSPIIYPTPSKFGDVLGMPYAELFRRFAAAVVRPQSTLFVIGYGFGDEHVNAVIRQAFAVPSFTMVVVGPAVDNHFVSAIRKQKDSRLWVLSGQTLGTFAGFVLRAMPDLREESIQERTRATYTALGVSPDASLPEEEPAEEGERSGD